MTWLSDSTIQHLRTVTDWPDAASTRYELLERLGQGGMGTVYRAHDRELDRDVALKLLRQPDDGSDAARRMALEARIIAQLEHPGIVPVHDVGTLADGRVYYVMKLVRGRRLDERFDGSAPIVDRLRTFERICETVSFAHAHGVIHRDLKPQNIMVGEFGEVLVLDWGVAKVLSAGAQDRPSSDELRAQESAKPCVDHASAQAVTRRTAHGTVVGTPAYMSPEQAGGNVAAVNEQSDVYALGCILFRLLTGRIPPVSRRSDPAAVTIADIRSSNPAVPKPLAAVCAKAMSAVQSQRYPSVADLSEDISRYLQAVSVSAYRESLLERAARVLWKYRVAIALVLAYVVMRVLLIFFRLGQ